jgi:hypothetical protein
MDWQSEAASQACLSPEQGNTPSLELSRMNSQNIEGHLGNEFHGQQQTTCKS